MELREYRKEDSEVICSWIKDKKSLYQWSANRIGKFPLSGSDLNNNYKPLLSSKWFIPFSAFDNNNNIIGHMYIRYPDKNNSSVVRFGFVIIDPALRGHGNGKKMVQMAAGYAKNILGASKVTLGVFTNNSSARHCYEAAGFCPVGKSEIYKMPVGEWECIEMELIL